MKNRRSLVEHVALIAEVLDGAQDHLAVLQSLVGAPRPGQPSVRALFFYLQLLACRSASFYITYANSLVADLDEATRRRHGLARPNGRPYSVRQIDHLFGRVCAKLDVLEQGIDEDLRRRRAELLQLTIDELLPATFPTGWVHRGSVAIDATLTWATERPPGAGGEKIFRGGGDGEGRPQRLNALVTDGSLEEEGFLPHGEDPLAQAIADMEATTPRQVERTATGRRRRRDAGQRDPSARWVGHKDPTKMVYGHAHHVVVAVPEDHEDVPAVILSFATTAANANPADTGISVLARIAERRKQDPAIAAFVARGDGRVLGDVLADAGYSQAKADDWQLPIKALEATPIFRLHAGNQEGYRKTTKDGGALLVDGRPYCKCLPDELRHLRFPNFPATTGAREVYREELEKRGDYELRPHGATRSDGSRRFTSPHAGGCPRCAHQPAGQRCCRSKTRTLDVVELAWYQPEIFGSSSWQDSWNRRIRIEGVFGNLKTLAGQNFVRDACHLRGYTKVTLAALFRMIAYNMRRVDDWLERQATVADKATRIRRRVRLDDHIPSTQAAPVHARSERLVEPRQAPRAGPRHRLGRLAQPLE